ncbi:MAG TPA: TonB-dependent receptor [Puia sp.]|nr:TonB-dependent receptor [Puia sp.]
MKLTVLLMIATALQVSARGWSQNVTVRLDNVPFETALQKIAASSGYHVFYEKSDIAGAGKVTFSFHNIPLNTALATFFAGLPLDYTIQDHFIVVRVKSSPEMADSASPPVTVSGTIRSKDGELLAAATIILDGPDHLHRSAVSDASGHFAFQGLSQGRYTLEISMVGYGNWKKKMTAGEDGIGLNIVLEPAASNLGETVIVGYGSQKKVSLTSSVETISQDQIVNRAVPSVANILQGLSGGLNIQQTDANPGYANNKIDIRGTSTISNNPVLYIVDGMAVSSINYLNPSDIESVSVLKDASATAIYGARASGGVLLVTTKKGRVNSAPVMEYDAMVGYQRPTRLPKFVDAPQFVDLYNQAQLNDNPNAVVKFTPDLIQKYKSGELPSTNWADYILNNQAIQQQHTLSVKGGSNNVDYYVSGGYLDQGGLIKNVDYKKYSARANVNVQVSSRLRLGINTVLVKEDKTQPAYGVNTAMQWSYIVPVTEYPYTKAGLDRSYRGGAQPNDIMTKAGVQTENDYTVNTNFMAEYRLLDNLVLNGTYGYNYSSAFTSAFLNEYPLYNDDEQIVTYVNNPNSAYKINTSTINPTALLTLNYRKSFGDHSLKILGGFSQEQSRYDYNSITRYGYLNNSISQIDGGSSDPTLTNVSGNATEWKVRSYFGRLNYAYAGKYLLEGNARYDGSSVFLKKRWGFFPSVSGGWVASEEKFFKPLSGIFSFFKLRASYGQVGNQNASGLYPWANTISQGTYILNGAPTTTTYYSNSPNPDLTWEVKTTANIGLDMSFLHHRLDVSADFFHDITTGILRSPSVPDTYGIGAPQQNAGKMRNEGYEVKLTYRGQIGPVAFHAGLNFSDTRNKILDLGGTGPTYADNPLIVGQARWMWYGLKAIGYFQSKDDIAKSPAQNPRNIPGDVKFLDANKDGKIDQNDRVLLGEAMPHYRFGIPLGFSYKGFDVQMLFQGVLSNSTRLTGGAQVPFFYNGDGNILVSQLDYWSPTNTHPRYPILRTDQSVNNAVFSSEWLWKSAYMRFKNLQVGYTMSSGFVKRAKVSSVRLFAGADNLFVITSKYFPKTLDPEIDNYGDGSYYPQVRNLSLGLNVVF